MKGPERLTASEAVAHLTAGKLTAEDLIQACLEQARAGAEIKAWTWLDPEQALAEARAADRARWKGRLAGVPVGVKDIIDTVDMPTEHGSPIYRGNRPFADAACVALIRAASGVILGKTVTTEFANRHPGATVHPHNADHTPGGSSSGSAAAVADFQVPLALGTQTGGSTIRPAAFCGVIGYKPSFGEFSRVGVKMQWHRSRDASTAHPPHRGSAFAAPLPGSTPMAILMPCSSTQPQYSRLRAPRCGMLP
jgi:Asp-tRNA(Asn)/Glu-tRNA(Gln) amidotransferase A subunit family amidase